MRQREQDETTKKQESTNSTVSDEASIGRQVGAKSKREDDYDVEWEEAPRTGKTTISL